MEQYLPHGFSCADFVKVPQDNVPIYGWMWNAPVTKEETERQLDEMQKQGIRAMYMVPLPPAFRPYTMESYLSPAYLTEEYFAAVRHALEYARSVGISAWLYDEGGWPSGLACGKVVEGHPELRQKLLEERTLTLSAGETLTQELQPDGSFAVALFVNEKRIALPFTAREEQKVTVYYVIRNGLSDLLNPDAVRRFIGMTHEGYAAAYGDQLPVLASCVFTDEPCIPRWPYLDPTKYAAKYGYDYLDALPEIFHTQQSDKRVDYCDEYSGMAADTYYRPLQEFCRAHGMKATGHIDNDHDPAFYVGQGGHIMRHLRLFDIPGIDLIWQQIKFDGSSSRMMYPHFASSAANQTGGVYAMTESFGVYGNGLSFAQMRYLLYFQAVRGINLFNPLAISYGNDKFQCQIERPSFRPEMPSSFALPAMNGFMGRLSYLASYGVADIQCAVFYPIRDIWRLKDAAEITDRFVTVAAELDAALVSYDVIDGDFLIGCRIQSDNGSAALAMGNAAYRVIFMPEGATLTNREKAVLDAFQKAGGTILSQPDDRYAAVKTAGAHTGLRMTKRRGQQGSMYLIYNEGAEPLQETVFFPEEKAGYRLNLQTGEIYPVTATEALELASGEGWGYLFGDVVLETQPEHTLGDMIQLLQPDGVQKISTFDLTPHGSTSQKAEEPAIRTKEGDFEKLFGKYYSGEAEFTFTLPARQHECILDFGRVEQCCELTVQGQSLGVRALPPYRYFLPAGEATQAKLKVGSTAAAAMCGFDAEKVLPTNNIGPYQKISLAFEEESRFGGLFGPVTLYACKRKEI